VALRPDLAGGLPLAPVVLALGVSAYHPFAFSFFFSAFSLQIDGT
jgi:hypothetical protein